MVLSRLCAKERHRRRWGHCFRGVALENGASAGGGLFGHGSDWV